MAPGAEARGAAPILNDDLTPKQHGPWFGKIADVIHDVLVLGGGFYIWNSHRQFGLMHHLLAARDLKVRSTIVWAKESFCPGFGDYNEQVGFCLYGHKGGDRHRWYGPKNTSTLWKGGRSTVTVPGATTTRRRNRWNSLSARSGTAPGAVRLSTTVAG